MDIFLDNYVHPKLIQEDINHLNRSITQNEIAPLLFNIILEFLARAIKKK
jgi:hypothetical protein